MLMRVTRLVWGSNWFISNWVTCLSDEKQTRCNEKAFIANNTNLMQLRDFHKCKTNCVMFIIKLRHIYCLMFFPWKSINSTSLTQYYSFRKQYHDVTFCDR